MVALSNLAYLSVLSKTTRFMKNVYVSFDLLQPLGKL